jgi:hypothetical protein
MFTMIFNESSFSHKSFCIGITLLGLNSPYLMVDDFSKEEEEEICLATTDEITRLV